MADKRSLTSTTNGVSNRREFQIVQIQFIANILPQNFPVPSFFTLSSIRSLFLSPCLFSCPRPTSALGRIDCDRSYPRLGFVERFSQISFLFFGSRKIFILGGYKVFLNAMIFIYYLGIYSYICVLRVHFGLVGKQIGLQCTFHYCCLVCYGSRAHS